MKCQPPATVARPTLHLHTSVLWLELRGLCPKLVPLEAKMAKVLRQLLVNWRYPAESPLDGLLRALGGFRV